ncbi:MAG: hypothetical protein LAO24_02365 [Acidobacteriia bacterium]|nr:hypothetical protein [Terriglobia bacterium]
MSWQRRGSRLGLDVVMLVACLAIIPTSLSGGGQNAAPEQPPGELVRLAVAREVSDAQSPSVKHLFRSRKQGLRGSQTKLYVQTTEAMAGMLIAIDDKPISSQQMDGELGHLDYLNNDHDALRRKQKQERDDADRTLRIVKALPDAFLYEYEGQEQSQPGVGRPGDALVRLKFRPNPRYSPPSRVEQVLSGMEGYLLIDKGALRIGKIDARLFRDVTFGWGILGHLDKGGTFTVCQAEVSDGAWEITHMQLNMTGKILLFKSIAVKSDEVLSDFRRVASDLTFAKGVELLKSEVARMQNTGPENASASSDRR